MTDSSPQNLRKAAVLIRSLDADTAATMLAQLSPEEARTLRAAIRALGPIDAEEQADVAAEFRRISPLAAESTADGVQLTLTAAQQQLDHTLPSTPQGAKSSKRFEFLEQAPVDALVPYLEREHVQTIAVVLSHLRPERAAAVLAALTGKRQAEVVERLTAIGDTDPESVTVVEHELAAWVQNRTGGRPASDRRSGAATSILAATDAATRNGIIANLKTHKAALADRLAVMPSSPGNSNRRIDSRFPKSRDAELTRPARSQQLPPSRPRFPIPGPTPRLRIDFDHLIQLDDRTLAAVLRDIDASVLVLALAGSRDDLIDRICQQMPKRVARTFRRQLRRLGPTRLSDVETAQRAVAEVAAQRLADRRPATASNTT